MQMMMQTQSMQKVMQTDLTIMIRYADKVYREVST